MDNEKRVTIKVLLAEMPQMLREVLSCLLNGEEDIEVVGGNPRESDLLRAVNESRADVVVLGCQRADLPTSGDRLLRAFPKVGLLSVSMDGRRAYRCRLRPEHVPLGEASEQGLVAAIRELSALRWSTATSGEGVLT